MILAAVKGLIQISERYPRLATDADARQRPQDQKGVEVAGKSAGEGEDAVYGYGQG